MEVRREVEQHFVNGTGTVLPVPLSQEDSIKVVCKRRKLSYVGIHWLRISFPKKVLDEVSQWCSSVWGESDRDGFGLWSYDSRICWPSGVSLNYDKDEERSQRVHCDRVTLDCPGSACDELTSADLLLLIEFAEAMGGKCSRIDVYFDDYNRRVSFDQLKEVAQNKDYSGLRDWQCRDSGKLGKKGPTREEISFGKRGSFGNGKYLRWYNKELESNGEFMCDRWEVEFSQKKADKVFKMLAACRGSINAFATLSGALIAGCITFVHRTGEKNINRLSRYDWWEEIVDFLGGEVPVRVARKKDSLTGKLNWVERSVAPSLACLKKVFVDKDAFYRWLYDVCSDGDVRMGANALQIVKDNESSLDYRWGEKSKGVFEHVMS